MPLPEIEFVGSLAVMQIQPGDTLVLMSADRLHGEQCRMIHQYVSGQFPGHKVLILDAGMTMGVARAAENQEAGDGKN